MLQIACCDDNKNFLDMLVSLIEGFFKSEGMPCNVSAFTNGEELIEAFKRNNQPYDVVFLDIDMPAINGKDVAKALRSMDSAFKLIFISAHENEVFNCFEYDVLDFIPKRLTEGNIIKTLHRTVQAVKFKNEEYHFFEVKGTRGRTETIRVLLSDIFYFESINRKVYLNERDGSYELTKLKWNQIELKYLPLSFVEPHRGYLVNVKFIAAIKDTLIELDNGVLLPLGRRNKKTVENMLLSLID